MRGRFTALVLIAIPLAGVPLHRNVLRRLSIAGLGIHAELLAQKGQLLVELASRLREFVKPRTPLGIGATVARCWILLGAARRRGHADVALPRGVVSSRGSSPQGRRRPRGGANCAKVVDVGRH
jgi:hypothetical protein